jgi:CDP-6-deoxy-D-xylo-4-hexulose-3-dehydrase
MKEYKWPLMKDTLTFCDRWNLAKFVLKSNKFTQGPKVEEFEKAWSYWLGCKHAVFVTSGSSANFLLLAAIKELYSLKDGDKVLVPACTWVTNINPVFQLGFTPIFCDVSLKHFSFDADHMERIAEEHPDIKIVFTTHLLGIPANISLYKKIFPKAIFLDDVCESHGARTLDGYRVGANSQGATFSFYFGHHMSTIEGGMVCTDNDKLYDLMLMKRSHGLSRFSNNFEDIQKENPGIEPSFLFVTDGYNFRNTEIAAVLGLSQIQKLDGFINNRRKRYMEFYLAMTKHTDKIYPVYYHPNNSSFCFPIICRNQDTKKILTNKLNENNIEYRPIVAGNLLKQPYLKDFVTDLTQFPNADIIHSNGIYVGNNQFVTESDIKLLDKIIGEL